MPRHSMLCRRRRLRLVAARTTTASAAPQREARSGVGAGGAEAALHGEGGREGGEERMMPAR